MNKWLTRILTLAIILLIILFALATGLFYWGYTASFAQGFPPSALDFDLEDFPGLEVKEGTVTGNEGQDLRTYLYYKEGLDPDGLIVISHGLGSGHAYYMDLADYFTDQGYLVYAYDGTGSGLSGGQMAGLSKGVIDLEYIIKDIKADKDLAGLPLMALGHSMGGHNTGAVLEALPGQVDAVAVVSAYDRADEAIASLAFGKETVNNPVVMAICRLVEVIKFGDYAGYNVVEGLKTNGTPALFVHSQDDEVILVELGYDIFYENFSGQPGYDFILYEDKGHSNIFKDYGFLAYYEDLMAGLSAYKKDLGDDYQEEDGQSYLRENYDPSKSSLDPELVEAIRDFFDQHK